MALLYSDTTDISPNVLIFFNTMERNRPLIVQAPLNKDVKQGWLPETHKSDDVRPISPYKLCGE